MFWWWYDCSEIVESKMSWSIKVVPARHASELEAGIVRASKIRISNESISNLYFIMDTMF